MKDPIVAMGIYKDSGEQVFHWASDEKEPTVLDLTAASNIKIELDNIFPVGGFVVDLYVRKKDRTKDYAVFNEIIRFEVEHTSPSKSAKRWKIPERNFINGTEVANVYR